MIPRSTNLSSATGFPSIQVVLRPTKMALKYCLLMLTILLADRLASQVVVFDDNFSSYPDGTTAGPDWVAIGTDCDDASPNEGLGISAFGVYNGRFTANDVEGAPCCPAGGGGRQNFLTIGPFYVGDFCTVDIETYYTLGDYMDCDGIFEMPFGGCFGTDPPDNLLDIMFMQFQLDNGPWEIFQSICSTFGYGSGIETGTVICSQNDSLRFRVCMGNNADDEFLYFDRLLMTGYVEPSSVFSSIGPFCDGSPVYTMPTVSANGFSGTWDIGPTFDPTGLAGTTVTAIFTPDPSQCALPDTIEIEVLDAIPLTIDPFGPFCSDDPVFPLQVISNGYSGYWTGPGVGGPHFYPNEANIGTNILTYHSLHCGEELDVQVEVGNAGPPNLLETEVCFSDPPFDISNLQDPDFPSGSWSGPGVSGNSFDPNGQSGDVVVTFTSDEVCVEPLTTVITVNPADQLTLGTASMCSNAQDFDLSQLADPAHTLGTWSGPGVNNGFFDPSGQDGPVVLQFLPGESCVLQASTTITVNPSYLPVLETETVCEDSQPLDLGLLVDPIFPVGTWSGLGVSANIFDPTGLNGPIALTFSPSANCVEQASTTVTVIPSATPQLETATLCETNSPFSLSEIADPLFPTGTWSGPGVTGNNFDPSDQSGLVSLSFAPSANCAEVATTSITVNSQPTVSSFASDCDTIAQTYTINLQLTGGTPPYTVDGNPVTGNNYSSSPIPSGMGYAFELDDQAGCGPVTVTGNITCSCLATSAQLSQTLCPGESISVNGILFNEANPTGTVVFPNGNFGGCDSTVTVSLSFQQAAMGQLQQTLCQAESIVVNGTVFNIANPTGSVVFLNGSYLGCDSIVNVALSFWPASVGQLQQSLCTGGSISVNGTVFDEANPIGTVVIPNGSQYGCDSTVAVNLAFVNAVSSSFSQTFCTGESISINGQTFDQANPSGSVVFPNGSYLGCDSVVNVALSFWPAAVEQLQQSLCTGGSISVNGTVFDEANPTGTVFIPNGSQHGCDSTVSVNLTFVNAVSSSFTQSLCPGESLSLNGQTFDQANPVGSVVFPNGSYLGCDSVVNVALSFWPTAVVQLQQSLCTGGSISVNGTVFDEANPTGTVVIPNGSQYGCDSTVSVNLTFVNAVSSSFTQSLCPGESLSLNGQTFDQANPSGSVVFPNGSYLGCDSVVNVALSFWPTAVVQLQQSLCTGGSISVNGTVFDEANPTGTVFIPNGSQHGCDSTVSVNLTFVNAVSSSFTQSLCPGESLSINGQTFDQANPVGSVVFPNGSYLGCDSVVNVALSFWPTAVVQLQQSLCTGGSISVNGTVFDEANPTGTVLIPNGSQHGCDSTVSVNLTFVNAVSSSFTQSLCPGESLSINGQIFDQANPVGSVVFPNSSYLGCDSTVVVNLSFFSEPSITIDSLMQPGQVLIVNGNIFSEQFPTGIEVMENGSWQGCDSTIFVNLTYPNSLSSILSSFAPTCQGRDDGYIIVEAVVGGMEPYSFSINNGPNLVIHGFPFAIDSLLPGVYSIVLISSNGLVTTSLVNVPDAPPLILNLGPDLTISLGETVQLSANVNFQPTNYFWEPPTYLNCVDCPSPLAAPLGDANYMLTASTTDGCKASDELNIFVELADDIYVPNAFSPNGDGINDVFTVFSGSSISKIKSLLIFDRWGDAVFVNHDFLPNDFKFGWNGSYRGKEMDSAVFVWFAIVEFKDGSTKVFEGGLTLVR